MKTNCPREVEILVALRRGELEAALREHALRCASCRATATVAGWLLAAGKKSVPSPLPDPSTLWWKSRIIGRLCDRQERIEGAERPLRLAQLASALLLILGSAVAAWVTADRLFPWLGAGPAEPAALGPGLLAASLFAGLAYLSIRLWSAALR